MIKEFQAVFVVFKQGKEVANPVFWKNIQLAGNNLTALLAAIAVIAAGFGYDLHLSEATLQAAGAGVVAFYTIVNSVLTAITSSKVGLKERK